MLEQKLKEKPENFDQGENRWMDTHKVKFVTLYIHIGIKIFIE